MKKIWKIYKYLAVTVVTVFLIDLIIILSFAFFHPKIKKADAIVVLGAAIYTPALQNRSLEGLKLYQQGLANEIVLSGGRISDKDISEAAYMKKVIVSQSAAAPNLIPTLIIEDQSHSTYENLKNTRAKIGGGKSIIIVSDQFHLARAALLAKRMGFGPVYWDYPAPRYYKTSELVYYYFREALAMIDYVPKFVFN